MCVSVARESAAAVFEHWQDKVGHCEARARRTTALQTVLQGVGVSNGDLHGSSHTWQHQWPLLPLPFIPYCLSGPFTETVEEEVTVSEKTQPTLLPYLY